MARRAFFSFHYERDIWRANVVRNSWVTQGREAAGFWDASLWEEAKKKGDDAIKKMIRDALVNTSVTAVLIGTETANRKYVLYEIEQSIARGNGLLAVHVENIKDKDGNTEPTGSNPLDAFRVAPPPQTYWWVKDDGYANFGTWVEEAARAAGR